MVLAQATTRTVTSARAALLLCGTQSDGVRWALLRSKSSDGEDISIFEHEYDGDPPADLAKAIQNCAKVSRPPRPDCARPQPG